MVTRHRGTGRAKNPHGLAGRWLTAALSLAAISAAVGIADILAYRIDAETINVNTPPPQADYPTRRGGPIGPLQLPPIVPPDTPIWNPDKGQVIVDGLPLPTITPTSVAPRPTAAAAPAPPPAGLPPVTPPGQGDEQPPTPDPVTPPAGQPPPVDPAAPPVTPPADPIPPAAQPPADPVAPPADPVTPPADPPPDPGTPPAPVAVDDPATTPEATP